MKKTQNFKWSKPQCIGENRIQIGQAIPEINVRKRANKQTKIKKQMF